MKNLLRARVSAPMIVASICLLLSACGGEAVPVLETGNEVMEIPVGDHPELLEAALPAPREALQLLDGQGSSFSWAGEFEQNLPHHNVVVDGKSLKFNDGYEERLGYALYWLKLPDYEIEHWIRFEPKNEGFYVGIANWETNRWNFESRIYTEEHALDGMLLVAVISTHRKILQWINAGDLAPPFVKECTPCVLSENAQSEFRAVLKNDLATDYHWEFGGGVQPLESFDEVPDVFVSGQGDYTGNLTVGNQAGSSTFEFSYTVIGEAEYEPLHLYAIPDKSQIHTGEEVTITMYTGLIPEKLGFTGVNFGLNYADSVEYVPNSFNVGAVGGETWEVDGIWDRGIYDEAYFIPAPDAWIKEKQLNGLSGNFLPFTVAPVGFPPQSGEGELCNLRLKFSESGVYPIQFVGRITVDRTFFDVYGSGKRGYWHDISNDTQPSITVLP